jgi:hypothetical protein
MNNQLLNNQLSVDNPVEVLLEWCQAIAEATGKTGQELADHLRFMTRMSYRLVLGDENLTESDLTPEQLKKITQHRLDMIFLMKQVQATRTMGADQPTEADRGANVQPPKKVTALTPGEVYKAYCAAIADAIGKTGDALRDHIRHAVRLSYQIVLGDATICQRHMTVEQLDLITRHRMSVIYLLRHIEAVRKMGTKAVA